MRFNWYFISIHALLAESDISAVANAILDRAFLSTLSLRRATPFFREGYKIKEISSHALLAESDVVCISGIKIMDDFYPRSPCGERHIMCYSWF